jgi:copper oxidase (laccase) domain-containing protein
MVVDTDCSDLFVFCSTKEDGNISDRFGGSPDADRSRFFEKTGIAGGEIHSLHVGHSDKIAILPQKGDLPDDPIDADAVITGRPDTYFYLGFADCTPLVIYDREKRILAFAHLGWKSTVLDLHKKIVEKMKIEFGSRPGDMIAILGPSIAADSYGFADLPDQANDPAWKGFITFKDGKYHIDLAGYMEGSLAKLGVPEKNIHPPFADTAEDERFFSHHVSMTEAGEPEGRFLFGAAIAS